MDIMLDLAGSVSATGGLVLLAEQRESVSLGLLVLMEQLSPTERAAFILRDAFGSSHRDVAELVGVSEENSRQLHRRARRQVPQGGVDGDAERSGADRVRRTAVRGPVTFR